MKPAHKLVYWWASWPVWVGYAASLWSLLYCVLGIYWTLGGAGYPFGENDPTHISILSELTSQMGGPIITALGLVATLAGGLMALVRGRGIGRSILLGFGWAVSIVLLLIIPDYRVLMAVAYGVVFLVGAPFHWPPADYSDVITWPLINQLILICGGFLWAATTLVYARKTMSACAHCGRADEMQPSWKTPLESKQWGRWAVYVAVIIPLLYALTRWAWALGFQLGITEELLREGQESGMWLAGAALATVSLVGAWLTLGLVQPWGEIFPAWIPFLGGKRVPLFLAVIPATLISILITSAGIMFIRLAVSGVFDQFFGPDNPATYAPELLWPLWGLALGAATLAYYYRRRGRCPYCGKH